MLFSSAIMKSFKVANLFTLILHFSVGSTSTIPNPDGPYGVSVSTAKLVDNSRRDPFAPDSRKRAVMVSMFYPSGHVEDCKTEVVSYMPPASAALQDQLFSVCNTYFKKIRQS